MQKTEHYQLNQWEKTDRLLMEDFNADNAKIAAALAENKSAIESAEASCSSAIEAVAAAAGNCKIVSGSYMGTGSYGAASPCTLNFDFEPKAVLIAGFNFDNTTSQSPGLAVLINGFPQAAVMYGDHQGSSSGKTNTIHTTMLVSFSGNNVSYHSNYIYGQMNAVGCTYRYVAIG